MNEIYQRFCHRVQPGVQLLLTMLNTKEQINVQHSEMNCCTENRIIQQSPNRKMAADDCNVIKVLCTEHNNDIQTLHVHV